MAAPSAERILEGWANRCERAQLLHFTAQLKIRFPLEILVPFTISIGPLDMEGWFLAPLWRLEAYQKNQRGTAVFGDPAHHHQLSAAGRWVRSERLARLDPFRFKAMYCGLDRLDGVHVLSVREESWSNERVWVVEGERVKDTGRDAIRWWFSKDGTVLRRLQESSSFRFEWEGRVTESPMGTHTVEYGCFEFPAELPDELFAVPPDAPVEEEETDPLTAFLERFADEAAAGRR